MRHNTQNNTQIYATNLWKLAIKENINYADRVNNSFFFSEIYFIVNFTIISYIFLTLLSFNSYIIARMIIDNFITFRCKKNRCFLFISFNGIVQNRGRSDGL